MSAPPASRWLSRWLPGLFGTFTPFASTWLIESHRRQGLARILADVCRGLGIFATLAVYRGGKTIATREAVTA